MFSIKGNKTARLYPMLSMKLFNCCGDVFPDVVFLNVGRKIHCLFEGCVIQQEMGHTWTMSWLLRFFICSNYMQKLHENNFHLGHPVVLYNIYMKPLRWFKTHMYKAVLNEAQITLLRMFIMWQLFRTLI